MSLPSTFEEPKVDPSSMKTMILMCRLCTVYSWKVAILCTPLLGHYMKQLPFWMSVTATLIWEEIMCKLIWIAHKPFTYYTWFTVFTKTVNQMRKTRWLHVPACVNILHFVSKSLLCTAAVIPLFKSVSTPCVAIAATTTVATCSQNLPYEKMLNIHQCYLGATLALTVSCSSGHSYVWYSPPQHLNKSGSLFLQQHAPSCIHSTVRQCTP